MEKMQKLLADRRSRAATLSAQRGAAEAALAKATAAHQSHLIDGDIADEKMGAKLHGEVVACSLNVSGFDAPLSELQAHIANLEHEIAAERVIMERKAAAEKLGLDLDGIEQALPNYLAAARRFANALSSIGHWHFESQQMVNFVENATAQIELATGFSLTELRATIERIKVGDAPIPKPKSAPEPVTAIEPPPPMQTVWMLRSAKFRDHSGVIRYTLQYSDCELPIATAQRALGRNVAVLVTDPRRRDLKGARGGVQVDPNAPDLIDLDAEEMTHVPVPADPIAFANFRVIDRSSENCTIEIAVPRL